MLSCMNSRKPNKQTQMKRLLLLLAFINVSLLLSAQEDLRDGFIISIHGDTIKGILKFQNDIRNSKVCVYYSDSKTKKKLRPFDIEGYVFENGKYYVSKYILEPDTIYKVFAEYLVKGQKDLFYYRDYSGSHYLISASDSSLIEIPYKRETLSIEGTSYLRESTRHIGMLKAYFSDCASIYSQIENLKKPDSKNLISITKAYHEAVCGENTCVVYKKQKLPLRIGFEPRVGLTRFRDDTSYSMQYGGLFYIWLPESNENLYFKFGFLYSERDNNISMYKIPLQFEYVYPNKIIRPKFGLGLNAYTLKNPTYTEEKALTLAASGGFLLRLSDFAYMDFNIETDILQFTYESEFFISHSFGMGVFFLF